jgi:hypothetical protein
MGLPSCFYLPPTHEISINIDVGWPTSLTGGERQCGNEFGCRGPKRTKVVSIQREHTEGSGGNDGMKGRKKA